MEVEAEGGLVSVTLVKPGAIETPLTLNAKKSGSEPKHVPLVYAPDAVASGILHCAETPVRDLFVGAAAKPTLRSAIMRHGRATSIWKVWSSAARKAASHHVRPSKTD